mmetsp:Transcript_13426/g.33880  ORF Transcript_13426/g.33880 Transcript_13426/m.33880 type:complete len:638 (+) Transcript_13426:185-2098(+)
MGASALVTGAGSGLGAAASAALAARGFRVTALDLDEASAERVAAAIRAAGGEAHASGLDVADVAAQERAFAAHRARWGEPAVVVLSAGIGESGVKAILQADTSEWQKVLDVNLSAVIHGTSLAARCMAPGGIILALASAGGIFPMEALPVYAASKAGVVHFVRSMAPKLWQAQQLKLVAICPQFVETPMVERLRARFPDKWPALLAKMGGEVIRPEVVVEVMMGAVAQPAKTPDVVAILGNDKISPYPWPKKKTDGRRKESAATTSPGGGRPGSDAALAAWATAALPNSQHALQVHTLSEDFRAATRLVSSPLPRAGSLPRGAILIRRLYTGVNASDVNFTAGRYHASKAQALSELPFNAGFESVGAVAAVGPGVSRFRTGQPVATVTFGGFSDYAVVSERHAIPVPEATPEMVANLTSGLTASIGLEQAGRVKSGETVLVTAAAGGTGQYAVQLAKVAGCHVIGTCGGAAKAALLRALGVDRVINYHEESVKAVLKKEYPKGVDVVYESVGGEMFQTCAKALARHGRLVVIGMMSQYKEGWPVSAYPGLCESLLWKSATCSGFFLPHYTKLFPEHLARLVELQRAGKLRVAIDREFVGLESAAEAVEYLQSGKSQGKVVVCVADAKPADAKPAARL